MVFPKTTTSSTLLGPPKPQEFIYLEPEAGVAEKLYDEQRNNKIIKGNRAGDPCSCVSTAKAQTGYSKPVGAAKNWETNSQFPSIGGVVVTNESLVGHIAVIIGFKGNNMILEEGNYQRCKHTIGRELAIDSPLIIGFWQP